MSRPLFQASGAELEALFDRHKDNAEQLAVLLAELEHRSTARAIALKARILRLLAIKKARATPATLGWPRHAAMRNLNYPSVARHLKDRIWPLLSQG